MTNGAETNRDCRRFGPHTADTPMRTNANGMPTSSSGTGRLAGSIGRSCTGKPINLPAQTQAWGIFDATIREHALAPEHPGLPSGVY